jgi:hypothetical protein
MDLYYENTEELRGNSESRRIRYVDEEWKRWDDDLVEDFSRWLKRVAKVFIVAVCIASAAVVIRLL